MEYSIKRCFKLSWFPHHLTDNFPWLFFWYFFHFPVFFVLPFNYSQIKMHGPKSNLSKIQSTDIFFKKLPKINILCKIPSLFPDWKMLSNFPRFSNWCGNKLGFPEILLYQVNVADLPILPNWPWPMKECLKLIGGLLGHVRHVFQKSKSRTCKICVTWKVQMVGKH